MVDKIFFGYDWYYIKIFGEVFFIVCLEVVWENKGDVILDIWVKVDFRILMIVLQGYLQSLYDICLVMQIFIFYGIKKVEKIGYEDFVVVVFNLKLVVEGVIVEVLFMMVDFGENIIFW